MKNRTFEDVLIKATLFLLLALKSVLEKKLDVKRAARAGTVLIHAGASPKGALLGRLANYILENQQIDGGWCDVEETVWSLAYLKYLGGFEHVFGRGMSWLHRQRHDKGCWGNSYRDVPRLPLTGLMLQLLPEIVDEQVIKWLEKAALEELSSLPVLTYKLSIPLIVLSRYEHMLSKINTTEKLLNRLLEEQNNDGGFGPWKDHPVGSEPWSTAFAVLSLGGHTMGRSQEALQRAVNWLAECQLPDGSWAYHYIDEGSSLACWALAEVLPVVVEKK